MVKSHKSRDLSLVLAALLLAVGAWAGPQEAKLPPNATDLVRQAMQHELKPPENQGEYFAWRTRTVKPNRTTLKQYVETPEGLLARVLTVNDKPLSPEDRAKEDARNNRLLDPKQMQQKHKEQQEDETRTKRMVAALPDAFIYQYVGTEEKNGHTMANLKFTPNPDFKPPTRESLVFQGMEGTMTIDATAMHLAKIDGTMVKDVSIGWGIIGHLDKGGHFVVEQKEIDKDNWQITTMRLDFSGKALIFKSIRIDETDISTDFRKVPSMTVGQALEFLKKTDQNGALAAKENFK
jgi:hypothetical protein